MGHSLSKPVGDSIDVKKRKELRSDFLGPIIGYMPQDIALDAELTIDEMLIFFGQLYGLSKAEITNQVDKLVHILNISSFHRSLKISQLSLGTQRRVSLICSLLHSPDLLLLDEPTVGSDPVVVDKIWAHLLHLRSDCKITIVLATHYLEEVNKADYFAFVSSGKVIIEERPEQFKKKQNENSLEAAILSFYMTKEIKDHIGKDLKKYYIIDGIDQTPEEPKNNNNHSNHTIFNQNLMPSSSKVTRNRLSYLKAYKLLTWRYWCRWKAFTLYQFIGVGFLLVVVLFTLGRLFGHFPLGLKIGVVNHDKTGNLSQLYLASITNHTNYWQTVTFQFEGDARVQLEMNRLSAFFIIGEDFSETFEHFSSYGGLNLNGIDDFQHKGLTLILDISNRFVADAIEIVALRSLINLQSSTSLMSESSTISPSTDLSPSILSEKFKIAGLIAIEPIYSWSKLDELKYLAPTKFVLVKFLFHVSESFSMILVMLIEVYEHRCLVNERLAAGGLHRWELITSLIVLSTGLLYPTYLCSFGFINFFVDVPANGGVAFILILTLAMILCGIIKGLFIGSLTSSPIYAVFLQCAYGFTGLFCGGVIWPNESLPYFIKPIQMVYPYTHSGESAVQSMIYGRSLADYRVYQGLIIAWLHVFTTLTLTMYWSRNWKLASH
ncbi:ABC transporter G family member 20-like isoform X2 [Tetranychus urticae]|nr:ABC transporter G family member 20-like isoform X2 [Tetranychus urticae]